MALRRTLARRLFSMSRDPKPQPPLLEHSPFYQSLAPRPKYSRRDLPSSPPPAKGFFRRILQRRDINQSAAASAGDLQEFLTLPIGDKLKVKLRTMNDFAGKRLRLEGLSPPDPENGGLSGGGGGGGLTVEDARKILRVRQLEKVKARLREIPEISVSYSEFVEICGLAVSNRDQGPEFARMLDRGGNVIVLGNVVFLCPAQVAKSMEAIISQSVATADDPRRRELEHMEKHKAAIDRKAEAQVRRELYCGLGYLVAQTLAFMRLTFWELSWDVMEPICFFVTSLHFAAGYGFFLRTSSEPTFESFFQRRFKTKQKRLMDAQHFDRERYNELLKACYYPQFRGHPRFGGKTYS